MPARAGVDDNRVIADTETVLQDPQSKDDVRVYMGDQNEVMLKVKKDYAGAYHRRWNPDGIKEILLNLEAIPPGTVLSIRDNKDRGTIIKLDSGNAIFYNRIEDAIQGTAALTLPWAKLKTAWRKAAGIKGKL